MSRCHNKDILMSCCIQIVIIVRKTLNESHKHAPYFIFKMSRCHVMVMKVSCYS